MYIQYSSTATGIFIVLVPGTLKKDREGSGTGGTVDEDRTYTNKIETKRAAGHTHQPTTAPRTERTNESPNRNPTTLHVLEYNSSTKLPSYRLLIGPNSSTKLPSYRLLIGP